MWPNTCVPTSEGPWTVPSGGGLVQGQPDTLASGFSQEEKDKGLQREPHLPVEKGRRGWSPSNQGSRNGPSKPFPTAMVAARKCCGCPHWVTSLGSPLLERPGMLEKARTWLPPHT